MAVPYTFASATTSIPLSELDANFATTITLGNTAIELGNTVTTLNNMTLANVTISSGSVTITDVTASGNVTLSGGTANGVLYLNGSKVATSGSVLTFDGAQLGVNGITVGRGAGAVSTNTAVGASALAANTSGASNTSLGYLSMKLNTSGVSNTGVGREALQANTTGNYNNAVGDSALYSNTTGANNTAVGHYALVFNTTASNNTAVGYQAGYTNTTGTRNTFIGRGTGYTNNGDDNTAVGRNAFYSNTTGSGNAVLGVDALGSNTTGALNTAIGYLALNSNTTASNNTAVGYQAGYSNSTGTRNTFVGEAAGYTVTTNSYNVFIGNHAGYNTTGGSNTFVGDYSGYLITSGSKNTIIGKFDGNSGGLDIRTADNYIVLSDGDGNPRVFVDNNGAIRAGITSGFPTANHAFGATVSAEWTVGLTNALATPYGLRIDYSVQTPNASGAEFLYCEDASATRATIRSNGGLANYQSNNVDLSDARTKKDINPIASTWDKIGALEIVTYKYNDQTHDDVNIGVIAQQVETVEPVWVDADGFGETPEDGVTLKTVYTKDITFAAIKALQEAMARIEQLEAKVTALESK